MLLPAIATAALGTALLVPLRDDRRGRRATIGPGKAPLRPEFSSAASTAPIAPETRADAVCTQDVLHDGPLEREVVDSPDRSEGSIEVRDVERNRASFAIASVEALPNAPAVAQSRTLLEPAEILSAMMRPFARIGSAIIDLVRLPIIGSIAGASEPEAVDEDARAAVVAERSFADEVASLLQAPMEVDASPQDGRPAASPFDRAAELPHERAEPAAPEPVTVVAASSDGPALDQPALEERAAPARLAISERVDAPLRDRFESDEPAGEAAVGNRINEAQNEVTGDGGGALKPGALTGERSDLREGIDSRGGSVTDETMHYNIVVAPMPRRPERAVPITRLPLRPQGFDITWTAEVPEFARGASLLRPARHALLERFVRDPATVSSDTIVRAYHQEEGEGRAIALRVLLRNFPQAGRSAFVEALRVGSDEERALAVDGLSAIGAREEIAPAFSDRVDAIAAKAALSYVGTLEREDYRAALSPFIDETRIEAILKLLAGIVE